MLTAVSFKLYVRQQYIVMKYDITGLCLKILGFLRNEILTEYILSLLECSYDICRQILLKLITQPK